MYIARYAYYCNRGSDADRCFAPGSRSQGNGWELAFARFGNKRIGAVSARSAVLATAAALRCIEDLSENPDAEDVLTKLPLFVATPTGLGCAAHFANAMARLGEPENLAAAVFAGGGVHVVEMLRYATTMHAGMIAQVSGVKGPNASLTGISSGLVAFQRAQGYLASGRAERVLVVCGESLVEWASVESSLSVEPYEIGCAFLLSAVSDGTAPRLQLGWSHRAETISARYGHFETVNGPVNLCWALEQNMKVAPIIAETDLNGVQWFYGVSDGAS